MQTTLKEAGPFERILTVQLDEGELEPAKNAAARKLSQQLKIKGFRPGKAPRAVVERMVGAEALRGEAIEDGVPDLVNPALAEIDLEPVTAPRIEDIRDRIEGGIEVDIRITLWPSADTIPDIARRVEVESPEVTDEEIDEQIDRLRSQYAELEDVAKPAEEGDYVMINLSATANGEPVADVRADDLLYEVGSRSYIPGLDDVLAGASAGEIREGPGNLPEGFDEPVGAEVTLRALVKAVRAKRLPEVTDEWVSEVSELDDVASLRDRVEQGLLRMKRQATAGVYRERLMDELTADLEVELPEALVEAEMGSSLHNLGHSLQQSGLDMGTYLQITGQGEEEFVQDVREGAVRSLKTRILLDAVVSGSNIEVTDEEIDEALEQMQGPEDDHIDIADVKQALTANGRISVLTGDILRRKALDLIFEASTPVDSAGNEIDLTLPRLEEDLEEDEDDEGGADDEALEVGGDTGDPGPEDAAVGMDADTEPEEDSDEQ